MKSKMKCTLKLLTLMIIFTIIGGCTVKQKAHTETSTETATPSSIKEDTATVLEGKSTF